ncbi:4-hydroxy-tetrahydrodipicolinate synthase 2 [Paenibacillus sp. J23TS9]|uniref:4-hydroxy-tetrahydrodipicolinate synthase n=1 Tax=Paenibacillus sp. J23TS9 TaxID=2807193 RepID=UPI001AFEE28B|nr:4-hydroxy-tetrahydrodipicolinate synthase [Paenibacillus sp. J23TS9]GIP27009.1 4-hydroxy-tetrahydrodipicolinate synthase 2 [Paenibacillus sp. J23TS9]
MMERQDMQGIFVPLITPFSLDGGLDLASYRNYVGNLLSHDIQGLVINGTTGEAPTVRWEEVMQLTKSTQELLESKKLSVPVVVGTGTNDTASTVQRTEMAADIGADAVLVVVPYYSKPSQQGIIEHFRRVTQVGVPVIAYEIPSRTGISISMDTARKILDMSGVIGIKDSSDSLELVSELARSGSGPVLCGDDLQFHAKLSQGASGGMLASANVNTQAFIDVYHLFRRGDVIAAQRSFDRVTPLIRKLFQESNPSPLKWILASQGLIASDQLRLPMTSISMELEAELERLLPSFIQSSE